MASTIANQFTGLPIENLIAAPLLAAAEGQKSLASTTSQFITDVGMDDKGNTKSETFQSSTKSSTDASATVNASAGFGCWKASFEGKVSHHNESNRSSDTSAKYSISVKGKQEKPEGLMKVLDMLNSSIGKTKDAPASGNTPTS